MTSQFSEDGKYFAHLTYDGKLKIWNTLANSLEQEYIPDFHLTTPCTCLLFVENPQKNRMRSDDYPAPKKKKKHSASPDILLGTTSGMLLCYSIAQSKLAYTIQSNTSQTINCLSVRQSSVYSGADSSVIHWDIGKKQLVTKWKTGNEKISAVSTTTDADSLLTASKSIKLWCISKREVARTFVGHNSEVCYLKLMNGNYLFSASKGDRLLNCWNLSNHSSDSGAVASFLMEDVIENVNISNTSQGHINLAATTRSGFVHIYQHILNGRNTKPIKPKSTVQVVSYVNESNQKVSPIIIVGATFRDENTLGIGYGSQVILAFENVVINLKEKILCLVRKDPGVIVASNAVSVSKIKTPIVDDKVHYLTPQLTGATGKRKSSGHGKQVEVPMEQRLENLKLNQLDSSSKVPIANNVAQLLLQGLHSRDKGILHTVLCKREEQVIKNTLLRLPLQVIPTLIEELAEFLKGKTLFSQIGVLWFRCLLQTHASILLANPNLVDMLKPVLSSLDSRLALFSQVNRFKGRLELLVDTGSARNTQETSVDDNALLVFNDKDYSDSETEDVMELGSNDNSDEEMEMNGDIGSESEETDSEGDGEGTSDDNRDD